MNHETYLLLADVVATSKLRVLAPSASSVLNGAAVQLLF